MTSLPPTELLYLTNTYLLSYESIVLAVDQDSTGKYVVLDQTIFHPQGGGQPSDQGAIVIGDVEISVVKVILAEGGLVFHYFKLDQDSSISPGISVTIKVNESIRLQNATAHSSGHLLCNMALLLEPGLKALKAYHFQDGPYVEFEGPRNMEDSAFVAALNASLAEELSKGLSINVEKSGDVRLVRIGDHEAIPCGGTHLASVGEIKSITALKVKKTKTSFRLRYDFVRA